MFYFLFILNFYLNWTTYLCINKLNFNPIPSTLLTKGIPDSLPESEITEDRRDIALQRPLPHPLSAKSSTIMKIIHTFPIPGTIAYIWQSPPSLESSLTTSRWIRMTSRIDSCLLRTRKFINSIRHTQKHQSKWFRAIEYM